MKSKPKRKDKKNIEKPRFKKGGLPGPGRPKKADTIRPIVDYLTEVLDEKVPEPLIIKLAENLHAKDSGVFLNTFKVVLGLLPAPKKEQLLSPHVMSVMERYRDDFTQGEVIEDISKL